MSNPISADISIIKLWFERAVPEPTDKNRAVQLGVHFEEVSEMLVAIDSHSIDLGALWSKFIDGHPVFDANGKIAKGKDYTPPNLDSFV